jgi:trk system potassium uptake protein TrkH
MDINLNLIRKLTGIVSLLTGVAMIPAALVAVLYGEWDMALIFFCTFAGLAVIGSLLHFPVRRMTHQIRIRDAFFIVTMCWICASLVGALPFFVSGQLPNYADAFFEAVSNITTTGANSIEFPENVPQSLLFWRSLMNWVGGMGILLFAISVLPALGIGTANLANAETAGSSIEKYRMRLSENAKKVYLLYLALTVVEILLLLCGGMGPFDAVTQTFGSISNSGLSNHAAGMSVFGSVYVEIVIAVFCILGAMNFSTLLLIPRRKIGAFLKEPEIRAFAVILVLVLVSVTAVLWLNGTYRSLGETIRASFLQIISFVTTAGYSVANYNVWPAFCKMLLFFILFIGGCSASTAGGIKVSRFLVTLMLVRRNLYKRLHPNAVYAVRIGDNVVPADRVSNITVFVIVYGIIFCAGCLLLSLDGEDPGTTAGAVIAALSNSGLGFGSAGYGSSFAVFSVWGRSLLSILMLFGRLELFSFLILFTPSFWRGNR